MFSEITMDQEGKIEDTIGRLLGEWSGKQPITVRINKTGDNLHIIAFTSGQEPNVT